MKKSHLFALALALMCSGAASAQVRAAGEPQKLLSTPVGLMAPVWSPDGTMIAVTGDNYTGIYVANANGTDLRIVSNDAGAGYKMMWSNDSKSIIGRANVVENKRVLHESRVYSIANGAVNTLGKASRTVAQPGADKAQGIYGIMISSPAEAAVQVAALARFAGKTIINPALSPDGNKIAFQVPGKGMWLINADGTGLKSLGNGSHPAWMPDSRTILYTIVKDNGSQFTSSTLMSADTNSGATATVVSSSSLIPLTPAVAPDGSKVAFENAADASIYVVNLKK